MLLLSGSADRLCQYRPPGRLAPVRFAGARGASAGCARPGGGYYRDDGPGCAPPADLHAIPDAVPRLEPLLPRTARPYVVFGREYRPMARLEPYKARGEATWYGRRYHGRPTSSGERYDMYAMTAAHPTLPIPSYVRVTNLRNGRSAVVRVNDRGPFLNNRLIDLSYTAAARLDYIDAGSAQVEVELITVFGEAPGMQAAVPAAGAAVAAGVAPVLAQNSTVAASAPAAVPAPVASETPALTLAMTPEPSASTPALATSAPESAAPEPVAPAASGYWLQFGAFGSADNADAALGRLTGQLPGLEAPLGVVADGGLYKLQAGPWPNRAAALAAAERVRGLTGFRPFPTQR